MGKQFLVSEISGDDHSIYNSSGIWAFLVSASVALLQLLIFSTLDESYNPGYSLIVLFGFIAIYAFLKTKDEYFEIINSVYSIFFLLCSITFSIFFIKGYELLQKNGIVFLGYIVLGIFVIETIKAFINSNLKTLIISLIKK